ncbi:MAG: glutamine--fructose-6-phosphate aminotransferase, partial [Acidobacteria bacterium]|nr:glutamine--fructose-6-phosphate aminotransferase [Acidobacteriota bacterium]
MCGIIGYVGTDEVVPVLLDGLRRLEYRGYDSAGIAVMGADGIGILRAAGKLRNLQQRAYHEPLHGTVGIGHTRWATHGAPTEANAHPQTDSAGAVAVVHNGILENYSSLRRELLAAGVELESDTDTELIAQLLGREDGPLSERVLKVVSRLEGQYAVVAVHHEEPDVVVAFRKGPPLVVGVGDGETLVASDVTALLHRTRRVIYLLNGDVAVIRRDGVRILDADGGELERPEETLDWDAGRVEKGGYRHFMLK